MGSELIRLSEREGRGAEEKEFIREANYLDIAERFKRKVGKSRYFGALRRNYRKYGVVVSGAHKILMRLQPDIMFTTNYDKLLETAYTEIHGEMPNVALNTCDLAGAQVGRSLHDEGLTIVKLHGDIDRPETIVLTREDYIGIQQRDMAFLNVFTTYLLMNTILFLGFSLEDPNFIRHYGESLWYSGGFKQESFAVVDSISEPFIEEWKDRGITVIRMDLSDFLIALEGQLEIGR